MTDKNITQNSKQRDGVTDEWGDKGKQHCGLCRKKGGGRHMHQLPVVLDFLVAATDLKISIS